jgi:HPt (histidine-containing phosphotransfer) domain-containing protein
MSSYPTNDYANNYAVSKPHTRIDLTLDYLNAEQKTIAQLEIALVKERFPQLIELGNDIYGRGASLGFERLSSLGRKIELAAIDKNTIILACLISSLKIYLRHLLRTMERESLLNY